MTRFDRSRRGPNRTYRGYRGVDAIGPTAVISSNLLVPTSHEALVATNIGALDDRPPFFDVCFHDRGQRFRRALILREKLEPLIFKTSTNGWIIQGLQSSLVHLIDLSAC